MISQAIFKAYDVRGLYPEEINKDIVFGIGQAYVVYTGAKTVVVGRDMRTSSPELFDALTSGLNQAGADVIDVGLVSTPEFYFSVASGDYDGGIMVTASHNPAKYNGLKIVGKGAMPIGLDSGLDKIRDLVLKGEHITKSKGSILEIDVLQEYLETIFSFVRPKDISSSIRAVVCAANGMAGIIEPDLWKNLGARALMQHLELDGNFPNHEANPLKSENVQDVISRVRREKADIGICFDGDGDRVGFVDELGNHIRGDLILALLAPEFLRADIGAPALFDTRCTMAVGEEILKAGGKPTFSKVGHALVKHQMRSIGAIFGGELSMHYYFRDFPGIECPDLVMLYVLKLMSERKKKLSELIAPLLRYHHSGEINFTVSNKESVIKKIEKYWEGAASNVLRLDGLRMEFSDQKTKNIAWWFSLRTSNTEPLLRLNLEARTPEALEEKSAILTNLIKNG